jgi:ribosomal protein L16 Arg81 hydroxylase
MLELQESLAPLVAPATVEEFFDKYWNRAAAFLKGNTDRFSGLFSLSEFYNVAEKVPVLKAATKRFGRQSERKIQAAEIEQAISAGATICAGVVNSQHALLQKLIDQYSQHFQTMGEYYFNSYYSPPGHGFVMHFDDHPVWILQIEGSKDWVYSPEPAVKAIGSGVTCPENATALKLPWGTVPIPNVESFRTVRLCPGDVLYLPTGCWHRAVATSESSLHLTLAEDCARPMDVMRRIFLSLAQQNTAFSNPLYAIPRSAPQESASFDLWEQLEKLLYALRGMANSLELADIQNAWRAEADLAGSRTARASSTKD